MAAASVVTLSTFSLASISFANSNIHGNRLAISADHSRILTLNQKLFRSVVKCSVDTFNRSNFPDYFLFGASTSALQIESASRDGGRGESSMDSSLGDGSGAESLYKYNEDVLCLTNMGADVYRFSIAWPRLFPSGIVSEANVNPDGLKYYINLFKLLQLNDITPIVTLFHFDLPKELEKKYQGTLSPKFVDDFKAYADFCFKTFGTYVKHWITVNEPQVWSAFLYPPSGGASTQSPPSGIDPYKSGFNILNAHAQVVKIYREKYKTSQGGKIGVAMNAEWFLPYSKARADRKAAERAWDFMTGWFLDPLVYGDYPFTMKKIVGKRLPRFSDTEKESLKGSFDFIGINYYMSHFAKAKEFTEEEPTYLTDPHYTPETTNAKGESIGPPAEGNPTMHVYPQGLRDVLVYLKNEYGNPLVYITENGYPKLRKSGKNDIPHGLNDEDRIDFIKNHLKSILEAIKDGSNVGAYCVWNLMDCMEFGVEDPYGVRFGLNFTDFDTDYSRTPKKSAKWYRKFLTRSSSNESPAPPEVVVHHPTAKKEKEQNNPSV